MEATFWSLTATPPCWISRRASPLEAHRPQATNRLMAPILPFSNLSAESWEEGIFSKEPLPENRPRAVSWALFASSSPWTSLVSS